MVSTILNFLGKQQNNLHFGHQKSPKRYKHDMILGDLCQSNTISSNFSEEIKSFSHKYKKGDYPKSFIDSVIIQFQDKSKPT